ncbi:amino acid adenylation domain-containing protein [Chitinophaga sp.]|uniref:non-ribosomal peptide synthetase n=1 Tax=Chitinophaga sp. TaxID=1869181 RepID=UPI0031D53A7A
MRPYNPTASQQLIWLDQRIAGASSKYNIGGYTILEGELSYAHLTDTIRKILHSQEAYRTLFFETDGVLRCHVLDELNDWHMEVLDFEGNETGAVAWMEMDFSRPFDSEGKLLFTFKLLKVANNKHFWYACIHHLISDGWSFRLLLNQTAQLYSEQQALIPAYNYSDYAREENQYYQSEAALNDRKFWLEQFAELPHDIFHRKEQEGNQELIAGTETLAIDKQARAVLQQIADEHKVSLFQLIISLVLLYFSRVSCQQRIAFGVPVLNRSSRAHRNTSGMFMNLLSLPFEINEGNTIADIMKAIKKKMSLFLRHQRYQYGNLIGDLNLKQQQKHLYQLRFSYEDFDFTQTFGNLKATSIAFSNLSEVDPLAIYVRDYNSDGFDVRLIYNTAFLDKEMVNQFCRSLNHLINILPTIQHKTVNEIELLSVADTAQVLAAGKGPDKKYVHTDFLDMWQQAVASYGERIAVSCAGRKYTYNAFNLLATGIASRLQASSRCKEGGVVGIMLPRGEHMIAAMLAAMMSKLTYVPIDTAYPESRIRFMLENAGCQLLLRQEEGIDRIGVEELNGEGIVLREHPCYIIYTSGSTGQPKGVKVSRESVADYVNTFREYYGLKAEDVVLQQASNSFDTSVEEIFPVLSAGGRLHILTDHRDLTALRTALFEESVTLLSTTPVVIRWLNGQDLPSSLHTIIAGGDVLRVEDVRKFPRGIALYNTYGPTESTVCATYYPITRQERLMPIGKAIPNRQIYILDRCMHLQPFGAEGEIWLGGKGLAIGYTGDPSLTEERFVASPFIAAERLYRTGDAGIMSEDGTILFRGRIDEQLSFRGYRIEAGEVEAAILAQEGVAEVLVAVKELQQTPVLTAYIRYTGGHQYTAKDWRRLLQEKLPAYMIPGAWVVLQSFPQLPSGKLDKASLPALTMNMLQDDSLNKQQPVSYLEKKISEIWKEFLPVKEPGIDESFFDLGGNSLNIMQLESRYESAFGVEVSVAELFRSTTIADHALLIESKASGNFDTIPVAKEAAHYPLSAGQRRMWLLSQVEAASRSYHLGGNVLLQGVYNPGIFEKAIQQVIDRHDILRTIFLENESGMPCQVVLDKTACSFRLIYNDLSTATKQEINLYVRELRSKAFDLSTWPLIRAGLIRLGEDRYLCWFNMHHIISDGWSMELMQREIFHYYDVLKQGGTGLPSLRLQYKDYVLWKEQQLLSGGLSEARHYWLRQLGGTLPALSLRNAAPRPVLKTYNGKLLATTLPLKNIAGLQALCQKEGGTLYMGLMSVLLIVLYRYSGQTDIIIGTPIAGRDHADLSDQIGFYVNTLALRTRFEQDDSFRSLLLKVREVALSGYEHQSYPFDLLMEELTLRRDVSRSALFDVMLVLQNQRSGGNALRHDHILKEGVVADMGITAAKFDLTIDFFEYGEGLEMWVEYNTDLFSKSVVSDFIHHFGNIINIVTTQPDLSLSVIPYLTVEEKTKLLQFSGKDILTPLPIEDTLVSLFMDQVRARPVAVALIFRDKEFTFSDLDEWSSKLASYLVSHGGVVPGDLVGVSLHRSEWLIFSLLAVLKAGAAYVPVDPSHPAERKDFIVKDSDVKVLIDEAFIQYFKEIQDGLPVHPLNVHINPGQLAYVIYTSGSTGKPKGCMLEHRSVVNRLHWGVRHFGLSPADVILQKTTYAFDVSVSELFTPLCFGCRMILCDDAAVYSTEKIAAIIAAHKVTFIHFVPTMLQNFLSMEMQTAAQLEKLGSLNRVITSGEELPLKVLQDWYAKVDIPVSNLYGPTETTVECTYYDTVPGETELPIGKAVFNSSLYVLDERGELLPPGAAGELYVGGVQVARGYLKRPALTDERFLPDPFSDIPGARMYKTGDLVRWRPDGNLLFLGRIDNQVKIRGYRVELGEVEEIILQQNGITGATVVLHTTSSGDKLLVAYVICEEGLDLNNIRQILTASLPAYMVPSWIFRVDSFPVTTNGKIDRTAFPLPENVDHHDEYTEPSTEIEVQLCSIWQEVLRYDKPIGINTSFFDLGGHSLKLMQLINKYQRQFGVRLQMSQLFRHTTVATHAALVTGAHTESYQEIMPAPAQPDYPVSDGQRRIWLLSQLEEASRSYHLPGAFYLKEEHDAASLEQAVQQVINRHEILRTVFRENGIGELRQYIQPSESASFRLELATTEHEDAAYEYIHKCWNQLFDLSAGPLLRAGLVYLKSGGCICWFNMHHIISDGWSMDIFRKEIFTFYEAIRNGRTLSLPSLRIQYKDYALWQMQYNGRGLASARHYWLQLFKEEAPVLALPAMKIRPQLKTYNGHSFSIQLSKELVDSFSTLCQQYDSTLFIGLLTTLNVLLYRYSGQQDIVTGTAVAGRQHPDLEPQIGFYVNTLPLRNRILGEDTFITLLERIRENTLEAFSHQSYPFDRLVEELSLRRDNSRHALFDIMMVLQHRGEQPALSDERPAVSGITDNGPCTAKFDYTFQFTEREDGIDLTLEFNTDIYSHEMASRLLQHYQQFTAAITAAPGQPIDEISYLSDAEREQLLVAFNDTHIDYAIPHSICDAFREQALLFPDHPAVIDGDRIITYNELYERGNQLAHYLLSQGVEREDKIGICMGRSLEMIVSIIGVLRAGAAYVPIDIKYPEERIRFMLEDTNVKLLLGTSDMADMVGDYPLFFIDSDQENLFHLPVSEPACTIAPNALAYIIYTSGSTGRPKGVMVEHKGIVSLSKADGRRYAIQRSSRFSVMASASFDGIVWEIYAGLLNGATLYIIPEDIRFEEDQLADYFRVAGITHCFVTTGMVPVFTQNDAYRNSSLQYLLTGGDQLKLNRNVSLTYQLMNMYGPTENTVFSTYYAVQQDEKTELPPIGKPIANSRCYILDRHLQLCPVGVAGELFVTGPGLARGYLNLPDLTAEKFIADPFHAGDRLYRTGDLARWLEDGNIEFMGRIDQQVKIRGYRVEPGEIAHTLLQIAGIRDAIVVPAQMENGPQYLIAYIVSDSQYTATDIRTMLSARLPEYMVPAHFVLLEQMPLTLNGKVDRAMLPAPSRALLETSVIDAPPRTGTEEKLVAIFQQVLQRDRIGIKDNFFDLGGNSMLLMKIRTAIRKEFEVPLQAKDLMRLLTIEDLAVAIDSLGWLQQNTSIAPADEIEEVII